MQTEGFMDAWVALRAAGGGRVRTGDLRAALIESGLDVPGDRRLRDLAGQLPTGPDGGELDLQRFSEIMAGDGGLLAMSGLRGDLVVPDFGAFAERVEAVFERVAAIDPVGAPVSPPVSPPRLSVFDDRYVAAQNADYIPALSGVEDGWAVSICTVDGQRISLGDRSRRFSIQSCCKPINYCQALEWFNRESGAPPLESQESVEEKLERLRGRAEARKLNLYEEYERAERRLGVHDFIDCEPSGDPFNAFSFNARGMPCNPLINAGAIMCASLISRGGPTDIELARVQDAWRALAGAESPPMPDTTTAKGESRTGSNNRSIAYKMFAAEAFPAFIRSAQDVESVLDFYFHCCSLMLSPCEMAASAAALANRGICPTTGERVFSASVVKQCLALMLHCGLYDASGRFGRIVGLPAKSGVGGGILLIVPGVMGICTFSPRLDKVGNSLRGLRFIEELLLEYSLHMLDASGEVSRRQRRVTVPEVRSLAEPSHRVVAAAELGDIGAFERLERTADDRAAFLTMLNTEDYDGRRALHLAACGDHLPVVEFLVARGADPLPRDRWGSTPLDDATRLENGEIVGFYERLGAHDPETEVGVARAARVVSEAEVLSARGAFDMSEQPHRSSAIEDLELIWAAARGDIGHLRRAAARGARLLIADYDDRTPLHLACAEGQERVVRFITEYFREVESRNSEEGDSSRLGYFLSWPDRWGRTPLDETYEPSSGRPVAARARCAEVLCDAGAFRGEENRDPPAGAVIQGD
ncbi:MAG: glutaminase [Planctomycetota bacterium]